MANFFQVRKTCIFNHRWRSTQKHQAVKTRGWKVIPDHFLADKTTGIFPIYKNTQLNFAKREIDERNKALSQTSQFTNELLPPNYTLKMGNTTKYLIKKSNLLYTGSIRPMRVTRGGALLRGSAPGLHSFEEVFRQL